MTGLEGPTDILSGAVDDGAAGAGSSFLGPIAGGVISGGLGFLGGQSANASNQAIAQQQMDFQAAMSNTAHQREVQDLIKAGLNPILSATGGSGASTPGGAMATMQNTLAEGVSSAKQGSDVGDSVVKAGPEVSAALADTASKLQQAKLVGQQTISTAKDVERKSIDNSYQAAMLSAQLRHGKADADVAENTVGARTYGAESEASRSGSEAFRSALAGHLDEQGFAAHLKEIQANAARAALGVHSDKVTIDQKQQALKYDYLSDKLFENMGLMPGSAKKSEGFLDTLKKSIPYMFHHDPVGSASHAAGAASGFIP